MMQQQPQLEYFLSCKLTQNMCLDSIILKRIVFLQLNHLIVMTSCIYGGIKLNKLFLLLSQHCILVENGR